MITIKLCGLRDPQHVKVASDLGVKYVGFVFFNQSPRYLAIEDAESLLDSAPDNLVKVGLLVNPDDQLVRSVCRLNLDIIQLHGSETCERVREIKKVGGLPVIKAVGLNGREDLKKIYSYAKVADQILVDAKPNPDSKLPGGNGLQFDWELIRNNSWDFPWFLAGGLNEKNVLEALMKTNAKQIDLSSGIEDEDGQKDVTKIRKFVHKVKNYEDYKEC